MQLSDQILVANDEVLQRMLLHRFVTDIKENRLSGSIFHRYLAYEYVFVETAISIFAYATACSPDIASQRWLIGVLDTLANTQVPYFEKTFVRLGISRPSELPEAVKAFDEEMLHLSRQGSFIDIVTAMFAAEWMYWVWCSAASKCEVTDPDLKAWVDLHATPEFAAHATWLKGAIDACGKPSDVDRLSAVFDRVIRLEMAFHAAAYEIDTIQG